MSLKETFTNNNISELVKEGSRHKVQADVNSSVNSHSEEILSRTSDKDVIRESYKDKSDLVESSSLTIPRPSVPSIKLLTPKMFEMESKTIDGTSSRAREVHSSFEVTPYQVRKTCM